MLTCIQIDGDGNFDRFLEMGFKVLHNFEEVSCDAGAFKSIS